MEQGRKRQEERKRKRKKERRREEGRRKEGRKRKKKRKERKKKYCGTNWLPSLGWDPGPPGEQNCSCLCWEPSYSQLHWGWAGVGHIRGFLPLDCALLPLSILAAWRRSCFASVCKWETSLEFPQAHYCRLNTKNQNQPWLYCGLALFLTHCKNFINVFFFHFIYIYHLIS